MVLIFPNLCLWRRSLRSNLGGIDPEKLYRATLNKRPSVTNLQKERRVRCFLGLFACIKFISFCFVRTSLAVGALHTKIQLLESQGMFCSTTSVNPLNPAIKISILFCCLYSIPTEVVKGIV